MELQRDVVSIKTERTLKQEEQERKMQRENNENIVSTRFGSFPRLASSNLFRSAN